MDATTPEYQILVLMRAELSRLQAKNPSFSLRAFAQRLKLVPSAVSEILSGQRDITPKMGKRILDGLQLDPNIQQRLLVRLRQGAKSDGDTPTYSRLAMDQYHAVADWYYFAILSLAETEDFVGEPAWIATRLNISRSVARTALTRLVRLGLLKETDGRLEATGLQFETSHDIASASLRNSHAQTLEMAKDSLLNDSLDERDISAITMAIDPARLPEAKKMIRDFRRQLSSFLEAGDKKEVYRFSAQLFPLSRRNSK